MKKLYWLLCFVIISVLFFQCQKENSFIGGPDTGSSVTPDPITTSIQGNITDENDQPAAGVIVTAGAGMTTTDANGYFRFTNASLDKNTTLVTASKDGYFKGYRVFAATSGCNQVVIKLIKKDLAGTVPASSGGEASLPNGAKIKLPAGSIVTASSNSNYTGDVKVYASYINPKSSDINKTIPGSLVANNKNGKRVVLSSYGMLAVELSSASGEKLQIKSGSVATLTIPIPSSSVSSAPATIPLWYIDETTGIWQEEGSATKQGNNYVGDVKHFSFWNYGFPNVSINLSLTLHTPDDIPLVNTWVNISGFATDTSTSVATLYGRTDSLGQVKGLVPANTNLTMEIFGSCGGAALYSQAILLLTQDKDLGVIKLANNTYLTTITGTLVNCSNAPVTNGYAIINYYGTIQYASTDANGKFSTSFVTCSNSLNVSIIGVDADAQQQSDQSEMTVTTPLTDVGTITVCGNSVDDEYINYKIDGADYTLSKASGDSVAAYQLGNSSTKLYGYKIPSLSNYISFQTPYLSINTPLSLQALSLKDGDTVDMTSASMIFTSLPDTVNRYYKGSFSGSYLDSNISHTISATFRIKQ